MTQYRVRKKMLDGYQFWFPQGQLLIHTRKNKFA